MDSPIAQLEVQPKESFLDERVRIIVTKLEPYGRYTLTAFCQLSDRHPGFLSHAHYVANSDGEIDVNTMTSYGGSYCGVEPMGLIWSMQSLQLSGAQSESLRCPKEPFAIVYSLHTGHVSPPFDTDNQPPVTRFVTKRLTVAPHVERISVRKGRIRGTLFVPHGDGPFKGVLDIDGVGPDGIIYERTASMLASRGYISLALAYQDYDDLPDRHHVELEYFIEALEWLEAHPLAAKSGLTVSGECFGGIIALYLSLFCKKVKAVITRNTFSYVLFGTIYYNGQQLPKLESDYLSERIQQKKDAIIRIGFPPFADWTLPIEKVSRDVHFLFIVGEDDYCAHPGHTALIAERLKQAGHHNFKVINYPLAGHLITLPYCPCVFRGVSPSMILLFGGEMYHHAKAQESAWQEILYFMENCVPALPPAKL